MNTVWHEAAAHEPAWGMLIVLYLFLAGLSAGAFVTSASALLWGGTRSGTRAAGGGGAGAGRAVGPGNRDEVSGARERVVRWGAWIAPFPVAVGTGLLVLDLGRPLAFYWLFSTMRPPSPMSWGVWVLSLFLVVSLGYGYLWLPEGVAARLRALPVVRRFAAPDRAEAAPAQTGSCGTAGAATAGRATVRAARALAMAGIPVALGVAVYTAVLLSASLRPLWTNPLLPQLFLFSALSTGVAAVLLATSLEARSGAAKAGAAKTLLATDAVLIGLEAVTLLLMVLYSRMDGDSGREAFDELLTGRYWGWFWLGLVGLGLAVPLGLEALELSGRDLRGRLARLRPNHEVTALLVLAGGFLLRYLVVFGGQAGGWLQ